MEFREVVRRRRMVRAYDPERAVPDEVVDRLLRHATRAPSAGNSQGWDFLLLRSPADRERYWDLSAGTGEPTAWVAGLRTAPLLLLCLSRKDAYLDRYAEPDKGWTDRDERRWPVPYWDVDTGMAALLVLLTAVDEGLGACFFGLRAGTEDAVRDAFAIPSDRRVLGVVSVGYAAPDRPGRSSRRPRRALAEAAHEGRFGTPYVAALAGDPDSVRVVDITPDTKDWTWVLRERCPDCGLDTRELVREDVPRLVRENAAAWQQLLAGQQVHRRPVPDVWSPLEYACHVRDVFRRFDERLALMLTTDAPAFPNWDQDATAVAERYGEQDPARVSADLASAAETIAARFAGVSGEQWQRTGTRSDGAVFSVDTLARYFVHDPVHHLHDARPAQSSGA